MCVFVIVLDVVSSAKSLDDYLCQELFRLSESLFCCAILNFTGAREIYKWTVSLVIVRTLKSQPVTG